MKFGLRILVLVILGAIAFFFFQTRNLTSSFPSSGNEATWIFNYYTKNWQTSGEPTLCPDKLIFPAPVDVGLASGVLYPGQLRGLDYKPHGGFRFDNFENNDLEVHAVIDGYVYKIARYKDAWAIQNLLFYVNDCGVMVMHDHLVNLSPKLEELFKNIPIGQNGDSRTTDISSQRIKIKKGEILATSIGYQSFPGGANGKNIFVDFGLYDLRQTNGVEYSEEFRTKNPNIDEYGAYALCFFDYFEEPAKSVVKSLPIGGSEGKVSDYCK